MATVQLWIAWIFIAWSRPAATGEARNLAARAIFGLPPSERHARPGGPDQQQRKRQERCVREVAVEREIADARDEQREARHHAGSRSAIWAGRVRAARARRS